MMTPDDRGFRYWIGIWGLDPSVAVRRAAAYLEAHGQRFLSHFGTDNAVDKAREHWRQRRRQRRRR